MNLNEYQDKSKRTMPKVETWEDRERALTNFALGLLGESAEVSEHIKKVAFHNHVFDPDKVREELGDVLFYAAGLATLCGLEFGDIGAYNVKKLSTRYPQGFSTAASIARVDTK